MGVLLAHVQLSALKGGYVGVDIFFVISGYLITALLTAERAQNDRVNLAAFYWRRARRLLPAVTVTVLLTVVVGFLILSNSAFESTVGSGLAALFSLSNIYFWDQVGYFDTAATTKPLLHTWSLAVEEQFYLVWPAIIIFILAKCNPRHRLPLIGGLGLASFMLNAAFMQFNVGSLISHLPKLNNLGDGASTAFYLMPFRIFEFALGAALVFLPSRWSAKRLSERAADFICVVATVAMVAPFFYLDEKSVFPYYNALVPALGTALFIYASPQSSAARAFFGWQPFLFIGKISYSVYLAHWPIVVYYIVITGPLLGLSEKMGLIFVSILAGYLLHVTVENPLRNARWLSGPAKNRLETIKRASLPGGIVLTAVICASLLFVPNRVSPVRDRPTNTEQIFALEAEYCEDKLDGYPADLFTCMRDNGADQTIVVLGDSHGRHLISGLAEEFPDYNIAIVFDPGCVSFSGIDGYRFPRASEAEADDCVARNTSFHAWAKTIEIKPSLILLGNAKRTESPEFQANKLNRQVELLDAMGHNTFVIGDFIRPGYDLRTCFSVPSYVLSDAWLSNSCVPDPNSVNFEVNYALRMADNVEKFIPVLDQQCPNMECRFFDDDGDLLHRDHHHLSATGAIFMIKKIKPRIEAALSAQSAD